MERTLEQLQIMFAVQTVFVKDLAKRMQSKSLPANTTITGKGDRGKNKQSKSVGGINVL